MCKMNGRAWLCLCGGLLDKYLKSNRKDTQSSIIPLFKLCDRYGKIRIGKGTDGRQFV